MIVCTGDSNQSVGGGGALIDTAFKVGNEETLRAQDEFCCLDLSQMQMLYA